MSNKILAASPVRATTPGRAALLSAGLGLLAGIIMALLAAVASHSNIGGANWSLSGNGALVVPFVLGSALLAVGWVMLTLRRLFHPAWLVAGLVAGLIALLLALFVIFAPIFGFGSQNIMALTALLVALAGGTIMAALLAGRSAAYERRSLLLGALLIAAQFLTQTIGIGYLIFPVLLALLLVLPLFTAAAKRGSGGLAAGLILPLVMASGFFLTALVVS